MLLEKLKNGLAELLNLWSLTCFNDSGLSEYAENLVLDDTRRGVIVLGIVSLVLLTSAALFYVLLGFDTVYVYSYCLLALLSLHMAISAQAIQDTRALYLLGIAIIVINGVVFVLLAHQVGSFDMALFASVILLFMIVPLVPWGMREALSIVALIYVVFTFSTLSVENRFDSQSLWILQFVILAAGLSTLVVIGRTAVVRRDDLRARYELEMARGSMEELSLKDPLTGAWNRRFLEQKFDGILARYKKTNKAFYFALIDVDNFKTLNDSFGHDYGDLVLDRLTTIFQTQFSGESHFIRMGGDEFAILFAGAHPLPLIESCSDALQTDSALYAINPEPVQVSIGLVGMDMSDAVSIDVVYRKADEALYQAKKREGARKQATGLVFVQLEG